MPSKLAQIPYLHIVLGGILLELPTCGIDSSVTAYKGLNHWQGNQYLVEEESVRILNQALQPAVRSLYLCGKGALNVSNTELWF